MNCGIPSLTVMMSMLFNSILNIYLWIYSNFPPKRVMNWNNIDNNNNWITAANTSCKYTRELYSTKHTQIVISGIKKALPGILWNFV